MARPTSELLTVREAEIMEVLWQSGQATAEEIRAALQDEPHDSTVRTLLRVLKEKGYVKITGRQPAMYQPQVSRGDVQQRATTSLLKRFFSGSADELVLRLLEDEHLTAGQLDQLRQQYSSQRHSTGRHSSQRRKGGRK